jgi:tRNA (adenine37-N6)-methyltransferase
MRNSFSRAEATGPPVLDVKPYMVEFAPRDLVTQPTWSTELMRGYY